MWLNSNDIKQHSGTKIRSLRSSFFFKMNGSFLVMLHQPSVPGNDMRLASPEQLGILFLCVTDGTNEPS